MSWRLQTVAVAVTVPVTVAAGLLDQAALLIAQGILQEKGTQIGDGTSLLFRTSEQGLMHVVAEGDGDAFGLALKHTETLVHLKTPQLNVEKTPRDFSFAASLSKLRIRALKGSGVRLCDDVALWFCCSLQNSSTNRLQR